jgi:hypothetical protein
MNNSWMFNLKDEILGFLNSLNENNLNFNPVKKGVTNAGKEIELGFLCYAIKIFYIIGEWDEFSEEKKDNVIKKINSFQSNTGSFSQNSFIDIMYIKAFNKFNIKKYLKEKVKFLLNTLFKKNYILKKQKLEEFVNAETKQAISTLFQVNSKNNKIYESSIIKNGNITKYLESLDWSKPWNAGAQFSSLCLFVSTQIDDDKYKSKYKEELKTFLSLITDKDTGAFFNGEKPNNKELINGAMKILTGLDWLDVKVPHPEKLIDTCLKTKPESEGCDLVDIVYVLYICNQLTNYKKEEIKDYYQAVISEIEKHYYKEHGGFSYYKNYSQKYYYGSKISKGLNEPDLHGTLLLVWAISMISNLVDLPFGRWRTLKP